MRKYFNYQVRKSIVVQNLITIEALETSQHFSYPEEVHEFYEFVYTDGGEIDCNIQNRAVRLQQGDFFLIPPKEKHFYSAIPGKSAAIFIVCFSSNSEILHILEEKLQLSSKNKHLLVDIIKEAKNAFSFPFDKKLKQLQSPLFGSQQLVESKIEELLICLIREKLCENNNIKFVMNGVELENNLVNDVTQILQKQIYSRISLDEISRQTYYSKTYLNAIFQKNVGFTIMQYYTELKIQEAKKLLREGKSATEIANLLNFDSPTYFTKVFKKHAGLTPSQYKKSVL